MGHLAHPSLRESAHSVRRIDAKRADLHDSDLVARR
jgi:hypothetical protein